MDTWAHKPCIVHTLELAIAKGFNEITLGLSKLSTEGKR